MIHVDDEPGPEVIIERVKDLVSVGVRSMLTRSSQRLACRTCSRPRGDKESRILYQAKAIEALPSVQQQTPIQEVQNEAPADGVETINNEEIES